MNIKLDLPLTPCRDLNPQPDPDGRTKLYGREFILIGHLHMTVITVGVKGHPQIREVGVDPAGTLVFYLQDGITSYHLQLTDVLNGVQS